MANIIRFRNGDNITILGEGMESLMLDENWNIASTWGSGDRGTSVYRGSTPLMYTSPLGLTGFNLAAGVHKVLFWGNVFSEVRFQGQNPPNELVPTLINISGANANNARITNTPINFRRIIPAKNLGLSSATYGIRIWNTDVTPRILTYDSGHKLVNASNKKLLKKGDTITIAPDNIVIPIATVGWTRDPQPGTSSGGAFYTTGLQRVSGNNWRVRLFGANIRMFDARINDFYNDVTDEFHTNVNIDHLMLIII